MKTGFVISAFYIITCIGAAWGARVEDEVQTMPEMPPLLSKWYSGYFDASKTRKIHYVLVESQNDKASDPLIVWFGGGPGFTSMLDLIYNIGPFTVDSDTWKGNATYNPYSLTNHSNVLYIDNPAGVGYSYAQRDIDWCQNDV